MKISYVDPSTLVPYDKNPKSHPKKQIQALISSIKEFGFDQPIVVTESRVVIKGHGRLMAALEMGLTEVPVVVRSISARDAKFLRVADNEVTSISWDVEALRSEMNDLDTLGFDLNITGFTLQDRDLLFNEKVKADTPFQVEVLLGGTTHECDKCGYRW